MTRGLLNSSKHKILLSNISLRDPSVANKTSFKKFCSLYKKLIREAKKKYFEERLETDKSNLTWQILREGIRKKNDKTSGIIDVTSNLMEIYLKKEGIFILIIILHLLLINCQKRLIRLTNLQPTCLLKI